MLNEPPTIHQTNEQSAQIPRIFALGSTPTSTRSEQPHSVYESNFVCLGIGVLPTLWPELVKTLGGAGGQRLVGRYAVVISCAGDASDDLLAARRGLSLVVGDLALRGTSLSSFGQSGRPLWNRSRLPERSFLSRMRLRTPPLRVQSTFAN